MRVEGDLQRRKGAVRSASSLSDGGTSLESRGTAAALLKAERRRWRLAKRRWISEGKVTEEGDAEMPVTRRGNGAPDS